jgi:hypothetical protein
VHVGFLDQGAVIKCRDDALQISFFDGSPECAVHGHESVLRDKPANIYFALIVSLGVGG